LYRGAWYEGTSRNRYGSAFKSKRSPIEKKRYFTTSVSKGQSDVPRNDSREFCKSDRNKHTARLYDELGLPEYEAIEAFKRFDY
jgi:glucosamine-6-phosphate deaminase